MGQVIGTDIIATPLHSTGVITLPPSLLTLGGRQYRTTTLQRTIAADVSIAASTLYFVYAQIVASVPVLRVSVIGPNTYRISNPTAKLVSAFWSTQTSPAFANFCNIFLGKSSGLTGRIYFEDSNGFGSTNTRIMRFTTVTVTGTALQSNQLAEDPLVVGHLARALFGGTLTFAISASGVSASAPSIGWSLNSSQLTTNIDAPADGMLSYSGMNDNDSSNALRNSASGSKNVVANDILRPHFSVLVPPDAIGYVEYLPGSAVNEPRIIDL